MNLKQHNQNGMKVWLSENEVADLLEQPDDTEREIAFGLGSRCGLRSHEVLKVAPTHVHETDAGRMLSVPEGKGDKYRETPIPTTLATQIKTVGDVRGDRDSPVVSVKSTRSLRDWIEAARHELARDYEDDRWQHLSFHDLRRTWATNLASKDVDPLIVLEWGGWNDLETFLEHYQGAYSPEAQAREREKVNWL